VQTDTLILGAGVIGLAVARELAASGRDVVVLERHPGPGMETSSRNSEVIHAGIYYPPGTLKALLCAPASRELYAWCDTHRVACRRIGKFIVATGPAEEPELARLLELGAVNGVAGLRHASAGELAREEPDVRATASLTPMGWSQASSRRRSTTAPLWRMATRIQVPNWRAAATKSDARTRRVPRPPSGRVLLSTARDWTPTRLRLAWVLT
jgi:L-2-hydroxyglutarate oxidase LhgO